MDLEARARIFAALGDAGRLRVAEALTRSDLAVDELAALVSMPGNLLAHHLRILEGAGLIRRKVSEGDRRRRYVSLVWSQVPDGIASDLKPPKNVAFVCTHNSARSQFAAAWWEQRTGWPAISAGSHPSSTVHPRAVSVASELGVDLSAAEPGGYERITAKPDLIVGVCDRAWEGGVPDAKQRAHWSVPDPVESGSLQAFRAAFRDLAGRVDRLAHTKEA